MSGFNEKKIVHYWVEKQQHYSHLPSTPVSSSSSLKMVN